MSQLELIRNEIVELQDEMEAIINAAEMEEGSELDEQDAERVDEILEEIAERCLLYTSPSPRDRG